MASGKANCSHHLHVQLRIPWGTVKLHHLTAEPTGDPALDQIPPCLCCIGLFYCVPPSSLKTFRLQGLSGSDLPPEAPSPSFCDPLKFPLLLWASCLASDPLRGPHLPACCPQGASGTCRLQAGLQPRGQVPAAISSSLKPLSPRTGHHLHVCPAFAFLQLTSGRAWGAGPDSLQQE